MKSFRIHHHAFCILHSAFCISIIAAFAATSYALGPRIDPASVKMTQEWGAEDVTIEYTLTDAPGIVTLDIETNRTGAATSDEADWISIGGGNVQHVDGDVNIFVGDLGRHVLIWHAFDAWPGQKIRHLAARAAVTVWATNAPPDYLVVDLTKDNHVRYYTSPEFLPYGGLTPTNAYYRTDAIVMRRIPAKAVSWQMGSRVDQFNHRSNETQHEVILTNDYYMAIYMLTRGQVGKFAWWSGTASAGSYVCDSQKAWTGTAYGSVYCGDIADPTNSAPCLGTSPSFMRGTGDTYTWPAGRHKVQSTRWLGKARAKTGVDFDLSTEAQWEFACRAGTTTVVYSGDFKANDTANLTKIAWFDANYGGFMWHPVGMKEPNAFGLYDMIGNGKEICLDWYAADYGGLANKFEPEGPATGSARVFRAHRPSFAYTYQTGYYRDDNYGEGRYGTRLVCPVTLKYPSSEK